MAHDTEILPTADAGPVERQVGRRPPKRLIVCMHCGEVEANHCTFEAQMPAGCQCDPGEWGEYVLDVCERFTAGFGQICSVCEHEEECHATPNVRANRPVEAEGRNGSELSE